MFEDQQQQAPPPVDTDELQLHVNSGANWFFWIAALSLINSVIINFDGQWSFAVGLGITQIIDGIVKLSIKEGAADWLRFVALAFDVVLLAVFAGFGFLGRARHVWAFAIGIVLFALDSLIFLLAVDILGIIIHAVALFFIVRGMLAARTLNAALRSNPQPAA